MIKIVAKTKVKPECKAEFIRLAGPLVAGSQAEAGNIAYNLHESTEDPNLMAFIEIWKDEEAIAFHNATDHYTTICPQFGPLFESPMEVTLYTVVV